MTIKEYEMELEVTRVVHFDKNADPSFGFGIYSCKPINYTRELTFSKYAYGEISLQGTTRKLSVGDRYEIKFEGAHLHPQYGHFYKLLEIPPERLNTVSDQDKFLQAILADNHYKSLKNAYPNELLVDLILSPNGIDTSKTKGIKAKTLANIRETVEKNAGISVLIAKLSDFEMTANKIERILNHFGDPNKAIKAIEENIFNLCGISHFGFLTVDSIALKNGMNPTNPKRIDACIDYLIRKDGNDGHTWSKRDVLTDEAIELLNIEDELVLDAISQLNNNKKYYIDDAQIALRSNREKEIAIYKHLKRIGDSYIPTPIDDIDMKLHMVERRQGYKFTEMQRKAIINTACEHGVSIINGFAGAGKGSVINGIVSVMDIELYNCACLSGKATNLLYKKGLNASTIHRMLKWSPMDGGFQYNEDKKLPYELIILDELSMNSIDLILAVLKATKDGAKIVLSGDSGQLPSIGSFSGDVLRDLLETKAFPNYELTEVHRQAGKSSGILEVATMIRNGQQLMPYDSSGKEVYGDLQDMTIISYPEKNQITSDIVQIAKAYKSKINHPKDLFNFQVIVPNREKGELSVRNLNNKLQGVFNNLDKPSLNRNGYSYREGDKILSIGNQYGMPVFDDEFQYYDYLRVESDDEADLREVDVYNGTVGYIFDVDIKEKTLLIQFEDIDGLVAISQQNAEAIELCYASTTHKQQGSGISHVVAAVSYESYMLLSRQMLYTMITRSSEKCVLLAENNAMFTAIKNDVSSTRRTFLQEIIRGEDD